MKVITTLGLSAGLFLAGFMWGKSFDEDWVCRQPLHIQSPLPFVPSER